MCCSARDGEPAKGRHQGPVSATGLDVGLSALSAAAQIINAPRRTIRDPLSPAAAQLAVVGDQPGSQARVALIEIDQQPRQVGAVGLH
jgi:hypothetical protein